MKSFTATAPGRQRQISPADRHQSARRGATLLQMLCVIMALGTLSAVLFPRFVSPEASAQTNSSESASSNPTSPSNQPRSFRAAHTASFDRNPNGSAKTTLLASSRF